VATYQDVDIYGELNPNGELKTYAGKDAIKNALQLWLSSKKGEYLLNPGLGGPLDTFSFKTMNEESLTILRFQLMSAIDTEFAPAIRLTNVLFNPDFQNRILEIILAYQIEETGEQGEVTVFMNTQYSYRNFNYEEVTEVKNLI
jgi:phage baseplate assembly protein W